MLRVHFTPHNGLNKKLIRQKMNQASFQSLGHAGAAIRLTARRSIRRSKRYAPPSSPPRTRHGQLRRAIVYAREGSDRVLIGPGFAHVGPSAMAHEFGGRYRKANYRARPFMGPALSKNLTRLPRFWAGSIR
jgi:phage gpG-like protein